jgi:DNA-damage-inducible protein D
MSLEFLRLGGFFCLEIVSVEVDMDSKLAVFEDYNIRRIFDEETETWYFSVVDIIQALLQQADFQTARKYWNKLKERLNKEGSESVTNCHRLKLEAADGKKYLTDVASPEVLLRLIQSVPSPKANRSEGIQFD